MSQNTTYRCWSWCRCTVELACLGLVCSGLWITAGAAHAQNAHAQDGRQVSLKDQLTAGLKARTPADKAFINKVVVKVENGTLPRSLVDSTFLWAREKAKSKSPSRSLRPMVYFQPGLLARTKKLGIEM